jgi:prephenate dehydratase
MRVAYPGVPGAYSEAALTRRFGDAAEPVPEPWFDDIFDAVESGRADLGFVPVENTIEGSITRTYDLLNTRGLTVKGETVYRVVHCLLANPGVGPRDIRRVYSHPQALGQTRAYLSAHGYEAVNFFDTAGAAKVLRDEGLRDAGAVASRRAAELYGLTVLAEGIETDAANYTRFLHVGHGNEPRTGRDKTSIAFTVANQRGALTSALNALSSVRITKLETRPLVGKPFEYTYFADFEGHRDDPDASRALAEMGRLCATLRVLGSYPRAQI